uniref:Uncharacterized protein n=1 Tax=Acrobeloides nanus TaxID=290746 RepID=A0A914DY13_9BILA
MFKKGMNSIYVNQLIVTLVFPYPEELKTYQNQLRKWIIGNITACPKTIFIFDEFDKMPIDLVDTITPFVDNFASVGGVDPRQSTFILVHNSGGDHIMKRTLELYQQNKKRQDFELFHFETIVKEAAYQNGALKNSQLIKKSLIDHYVPFLPLEEAHVKKCIQDYIEENDHLKLNKRQINCIISYIPFEEDIFSKSGCRQVEEKVRLVLKNPNIECEPRQIKKPNENSSPPQKQTASTQTDFDEDFEREDQPSPWDKFKEYWLTPLILLGVVLTSIWLLRLGSRGAFVFIFISFGFYIQYMKRYQEILANRVFESLKDDPCKKQEYGTATLLFTSLWNSLFSIRDKDPCLVRIENAMKNPVYDVAVEEVISSMLSTFILTPLSHIGLHLNKFLNEFYKETPLWLVGTKTILLIFFTILSLLVCIIILYFILTSIFTPHHRGQPPGQEQLQQNNHQTQQIQAPNGQPPSQKFLQGPSPNQQTPLGQQQPNRQHQETQDPNHFSIHHSPRLAKNQSQNQSHPVNSSQQVQPIHVDQDEQQSKSSIAVHPSINELATKGTMPEFLESLEQHQDSTGSRRSSMSSEFFKVPESTSGYNLGEEDDDFDMSASHIGANELVN